MVLCYIAVPSAPAADRVILYTNNNRIGYLTGTAGNVLTNGAIDVGGPVNPGAGTTGSVGNYGLTVHPYVIQCDETHGVVRAYTDLETVTSTTFTDTTNYVFIGGTGFSSGGPVMVTPYGALWTGSLAEVSPTQVRAMLNLLAP